MGAELKGVCTSHYRSEGHEQAKGRSRKRESKDKNSITIFWHYWLEPHIEVISFSHSSLLSEPLTERDRKFSSVVENSLKIKTMKRRNSDKLPPGFSYSLVPTSVACSWVRCLEAWEPILVGAPGTILAFQAADRELSKLKFPSCLGCWRTKALVVMELGILATLKSTASKGKLGKF